MKPNTHYKFTTSGSGGVHADFEYDLALYTPFAIGESLDDINMDNISFSSLSGRGGVDLEAAVDYPILPKLTVGGTVSHIPIFPAELTNYSSIRGGTELNSDDFLNELINGGNLEDLLKDKTVESSYDSLQIFRPFKLGINAVYTPFNFRLFSLSLIPQIGYAYNAIYVKPHSFEGTAKVQVGLFNIMRTNPLLIFTFVTGYEDKLWKHGVGMTLNLRAMQLDVGITAQSENFKKSFQGAGIDLNFGICFGW
jgi:hypothetical protein